MPTTPTLVVRALRAVEYDGTNSAELAALIDDFTVVSEDASGLTFTSDGQTLFVPPNGWLVYGRGVVAPTDVFANEDDYRDEYADADAAQGTHIHTVTLTSSPGIPVTGF